MQHGAVLPKVRARNSGSVSGLLSSCFIKNKSISPALVLVFMCSACSWWTGEWSECSRSCNSGLRTRQVLCKRRLSVTEEKVLDDSACSPLRPSLTEPCNNRSCPPEWLALDWSEVGGSLSFSDGVGGESSPFGVRELRVHPPGRGNASRFPALLGILTYFYHQASKVSGALMEGRSKISVQACGRCLQTEEKQNAPAVPLFHRASHS